MNRNPRNTHLLAQVGSTNPFKDTLVPRIFAIGNSFERAVEDVVADGRLSQKGKTDAARVHLQKALRELDDVEKPIADYRKQTAQLSSEKKKPVFDKTDSVAALNRKEFRERSERMSFGQKTMLMIGPKRSVAFLDAMIFEFEDDPWMSGLDLDNPNEAELYEEAKQSRLRDLNGPLMDALEARIGVEAEIKMVIDIVRGDLESDATDLTERAA